MDGGHGGTADEDGNDVLNPIDSRYVSVTAGYDWRYNGDDLFGVMGGYVYGKSTVDSTWVESILVNLEVSSRAFMAAITWRPCSSTMP